MNLRQTDLQQLPIWWLVVCLLLMGGGIVVTHLNADILAQNEENTIDDLMRSVRHAPSDNPFLTKPEIMQSIAVSSPQHVPGYYLLVSMWGDWVGNHLMMLRLVTGFAYLLSVAMVYRLSCDWFGGRVGAFSAFFATFAAYHVYYAHEIRMYDLVVLQMLAVIWLYWRIILSTRKPNWSHYLGLYLWTTFGIYTHIIIIFPLLGLGVYHLLIPKKNRSWVRVAGVMILSGLSFLPWLPTLINGFQTAKDLSATNQSTIEVLGSGLFIYSNGFWIAGLLLLCLMLWKRPRHHRHFQFFAIWGGVFIILMLIANVTLEFLPYRRMRYSLIVLPVLTIAWGYGLNVIFRYSRWGAGILSIGWLVMFGWFMQSDELYVATNLASSNFRDELPLTRVAEHVFTNFRDVPQDKPYVAIFDASNRQGFTEYYNLIYDVQLLSFTPGRVDEDVEDIEKLQEDSVAYWFAYQSHEMDALQSWQSDDRIAKVFDAYQECREIELTDDIILTYRVHIEIPCTLFDSPNENRIEFINDYNLRNYAIEQSDDGLNVLLWWSTPDMIFDNAYGYSLQVFRDGEKVGQSDLPIHSAITQNKIELIESDSGTYTVQLIVYSSDDVKSVGGQTDVGVVFERDVELGQVIIQID